MAIELPWGDSKVAQLIKTDSETSAALADILQGVGGTGGTLVLGPQDPIPANTPAGTVVYRTAT